jgi:general transcription factor 3C polypeptide 3 (transcription factor C subunit 4)
MRKLPNIVLHERVKVLGEQRPDSVFQGLRPIASPDELYVQCLFTSVSYV